MSKYFEICPTSKTTVKDLGLMNKYVNTKFCINPETGSIGMLKDAEYEGISYTSCVHDSDNLINLCGLLYLGRLQKCKSGTTVITGVRAVAKELCVLLV